MSFRQYNVMIPKSRQRKISRPVSCVDFTSGSNPCVNKTLKAIGGGIGYLLETDAANPFLPLVFYRDSNQRLAFSSTSSLPRLVLSTDAGFIYLGANRKLIAARPDRSPAQFVKPLPFGLRAKPGFEVAQRHGAVFVHKMRGLHSVVTFKKLLVFLF